MLPFVFLFTICGTLATVGLIILWSDSVSSENVILAAMCGAAISACILALGYIVGCT